MPYHLRQVGSRWQVMKSDDGKVMGTHKSRADAVKQIAAIQANERKGKK